VARDAEVERLVEARIRRARETRAAIDRFVCERSVESVAVCTGFTPATFESWVTRKARLALRNARCEMEGPTPVPVPVRDCGRLDRQRRGGSRPGEPAEP
jgi:hypothetical protein